MNEGTNANSGPGYTNRPLHSQSWLRMTPPEPNLSMWQSVAIRLGVHAIAFLWFGILIASLAAPTLGLTFAAGCLPEQYWTYGIFCATFFPFTACSFAWWRWRRRWLPILERTFKWWDRVDCGT
jgi:hypothetical protein